MAAVTKVSAWSISIKKTDKGFQARVFKGWYDPGEKERPTYFNRRELHKLMEHLENVVIPQMEDKFIPIKTKATPQ